MCAFILKRISRIILFSENCIFQTMTEGPRLLVVKLCQRTIVYFPIIIFCLYSIAQKIINLLFSFSFESYNRIIGIELIAPLALSHFQFFSPQIALVHGAQHERMYYSKNCCTGTFQNKCINISSTLALRDFTSAIHPLQNSSNNLRNTFLRQPNYTRFLKIKTNV